MPDTAGVGDASQMAAGWGLAAALGFNFSQTVTKSGTLLFFLNLTPKCVAGEVRRGGCIGFPSARQANVDSLERMAAVILYTDTTSFATADCVSPLNFASPAHHCNSTRSICNCFDDAAARATAFSRSATSEVLDPKNNSTALTKAARSELEFKSSTSSRSD